MGNTHDNTAARVIKVLSIQSAEHESNIKPEHRLNDDLGCDSFDRIELAMALEEEFNVDIDEDKFEHCRTVQDVIELVLYVCTSKQLRVEAMCKVHHPACECREHKVATLNKAALDCAMELDWIKNEFSISGEKLESIKANINRVYVASHALAAR